MNAALQSHVLKGLDAYLLTGNLWSERATYRARVTAELDKIEERGLTPFFFVAKTLSDFLRSKGLKHELGPGKSCGALVTLSLGLSCVDPLAFGLYFEPFICGTISSPSLSFAIDSDAMAVATNLLGSISSGRLVALDIQGCFAWGAFPSNCVEPVRHQGIACRFQFPTVILVPSAEVGGTARKNLSGLPAALETAVAALIAGTADQACSFDQGDCPECLSDFLASTSGTMIFYEQLWAVLQTMFGANMASAEQIAFALRRGGAGGDRAKAKLLGVTLQNDLPMPVRRSVIDYVAKRARYLKSRAYFLSAAFDQSCPMPALSLESLRGS